MKTLRKILSDQEGATLVMVALMLVVLMGITSLVTDVGILTKTKRHLIATADAAALAGAQELAVVPIATDPDYNSKRDEAIYKAKVKAKEYAEKNYPGLVVNDNTIIVNYTSTEKSVAVPLTKDGIGLTFARVLGHKFGTVAASAKAAIEYVDTLETDGHSGNILPFSLYYTTFQDLDESESFLVKDTGIVIKDDGTSASGNWGTVAFYDLDGNCKTGNNVLKYLCSGGYLQNGNPGDLLIGIGEPMDTETGVKASAAMELDDWLDREYSRTGKREITGLVPIYNEGFDKNGNATTIIYGFTMVTITDVISKKEIEAYLNPKAFVTDYKGTTTSVETEYNYGAKVITLVD